MDKWMRAPDFHLPSYLPYGKTAGPRYPMNSGGPCTTIPMMQWLNR